MFAFPFDFDFLITLLSCASWAHTSCHDIATGLHRPWNVQCQRNVVASCVAAIENNLKEKENSGVSVSDWRASGGGVGWNHVYGMNASKGFKILTFP